jgi:hypothetical protein
LLEALLSTVPTKALSDAPLSTALPGASGASPWAW